MATCTFCQAVIKSPENAIYDGTACSYVCLGKANAQDGGVPV